MTIKRWLDLFRRTLSEIHLTEGIWSWGVEIQYRETTIAKIEAEYDPQCQIHQ